MTIKPTIAAMLFSLAFAIPVIAQQERKLVRDGVKNYHDNKFSEAEVSFRKAQDAKPGLYEAEYDIANSLYKQKKYEEAANEYEKLIQKNNNPGQRADLFHNLGNSHLMAQQYEKGVEAYKNSLRIRPNDEDTRYNLAYALEKMKEQQQQQKDQNKDKNKQDQQKKDDKNKQDQQKNEDKDKDKDQQNQDQQDKENQDKKDKQQQQQDNQQDKKDNQQKQQQGEQPQNVSKQDAEQMLNAVQNQEKETKEKADKKKAVLVPVKTDKDW